MRNEFKNPTLPSGAVVLLLGLVAACTGPSTTLSLSVQSVTPSAGPTGGSATITIAGTGFQPGATVTMDGVAAKVVSTNSAALVVTTASHKPGAVDIVVTNPDGRSATLTGGYAFNAPPVLISMSAGPGSTEGGLPLNVDGTGFSSTVTLTIGGGIAYKGSIQGSTFFMAASPPGAAGPADAVLTNADGQTSTLKNAFLYVPPSSLNWNGDWKGWSTWNLEFFLDFTIQDNKIVRVVCNDSPNLVSTPVPLASNGSFSVTANGMTMSGKIVGVGYWRGQTSGTFCSGDGPWIAMK